MIYGSALQNPNGVRENSTMEHLARSEEVLGWYIDRLLYMECFGHVRGNVTKLDKSYFEKCDNYINLKTKHYL